MGRPESGPYPFWYPILGAFVGYMLGWCIAVMIKDQPFEWIQGGFGTSGPLWSATAFPYCLWSWLGLILGGTAGYKVMRMP